ncbi:hypothetical protein [Halopseudomonas bauzanensis]|uniref:hypothetical protein n=1 Tax=Halopseudomonas bauzanensis TaxID=653930 RepID=UPI00255594E9|nr:hypothetical protein [Halopseudomonas bauzanensis]
MQDERQKAVQKQQREARKTIKKLKSEVCREDRALAETTSLLELFYDAVAGGAARCKAARLMDISERTLKRLRDTDGQVAKDRRPEAERIEQPHKLTQVEELAILSACNQPRPDRVETFSHYETQRAATVVEVTGCIPYANVMKNV